MVGRPLVVVDEHEEVGVARVGQRPVAGGRDARRGLVAVAHHALSRCRGEVGHRRAGATRRVVVDHEEPGTGLLAHGGCLLDEHRQRGRDVARPPVGQDGDDDLGPRRVDRVHPRSPTPGDRSPRSRFRVRPPHDRSSGASVLGSGGGRPPGCAGSPSHHAPGVHVHIRPSTRELSWLGAVPTLAVVVVNYGASALLEANLGQVARRRPRRLAGRSSSTTSPTRPEQAAVRAALRASGLGGWSRRRPNVGLRVRDEPRRPRRARGRGVRGAPAEPRRPHRRGEPGARLGRGGPRGAADHGRRRCCAPPRAPPLVGRAATSTSTAAGCGRRAGGRARPGSRSG